jgi:hypothetical protein
MYFTPMAPSPPTRMCCSTPSLMIASGSPVSIDVRNTSPQKGRLAAVLLERGRAVVLARSGDVGLDAHRRSSRSSSRPPSSPTRRSCRAGVVECGCRCAAGTPCRAWRAAVGILERRDGRIHREHFRHVVVVDEEHGYQGYIAKEKISLAHFRYKSGMEFFAFEGIGDPATWVQLVTLAGLEIVLGVDNLVFIAILTERLPPEKRSFGRRLGLALALVTRLMLLAAIAWIVSLTAPFLHILGFGLSWRDIILLAGGLFLIYKADTGDTTPRPRESRRNKPRRPPRPPRSARS